MRTARWFATLASLALLGVVSDQPAPAARPVAGPAAPAARAASAVPRFALFGWVSPPASITDDARIAEMEGVGFDLAMAASNDSGHLEDNLRRLDLAAAHGMKCLIWDERFERFLTLDPDSAEGQALLDSIVADYRDRPGFFGYDLGDEPAQDTWPLLVRIGNALRARDPDHPAWNNLLGRAPFPDRATFDGYLQDYLQRFRPQVLSVDHYDFLTTGDRGQFVENLAVVSADARTAGVPFWIIVLLVRHTPYRQVTPGELAWQASMALAYGARGVGYFTYWTPPPDTLYTWGDAVIDTLGRRTAWYPVLGELNRHVGPAGETLAGLTWLGTEHAGSVPAGGVRFVPDDLLISVAGRAALGQFADSAGARYLLVANSDSLRAATLGLEIAGARRVWQLGTDVGDWREASPEPTASGERLQLALDPGAFTLLRFGGAFEPVFAGRGPGLRLVPNPAHGTVRIALSRAGARAYVEVLDLAGRRVRAWHVPEGSAGVLWSGDRDGGGWAHPGAYLVRAEDAGGVTVNRLVWLGRR